MPAQLVHLVVLAPARSLELELATPASRARARLRQRAGWAPAVPHDDTDEPAGNDSRPTRWRLTALTSPLLTSLTSPLLATSSQGVSPQAFSMAWQQGLPRDQQQLLSAALSCLALRWAASSAFVFPTLCMAKTCRDARTA